MTWEEEILRLIETHPWRHCFNVGTYLTKEPGKIPQEVCDRIIERLRTAGSRAAPGAGL